MSQNVESNNDFFNLSEMFSNLSIGLLGLSAGLLLTGNGIGLAGFVVGALMMGISSVDYKENTIKAGLISGGTGFAAGLAGGLVLASI